MKLNKIFLAIHIIVASLLFSSCKDDLDFGSGYIGDGEALVSGTLEFRTLDTRLGGSRSEGEALDAINTVTVLVYNADDTRSLKDVYNIETLKKNNPTNNTPSDYPTDDKGQPNTTDNATAKVNFDLGILPYGKYYIYAVVNLDRKFTKEDADIQTVGDLKSIQCQWDPENIYNNCQMFGYFTTVTNANGSTGTIFGDPETGEDPAVVINSQNVILYSWVRRLASKVTVAYDGSGLNDNVTVYIHNVSIRQIPYYCSLGNDNTPSKNSDSWNPAEETVSPAYFQQSVTTPSQVLYYNNENKGYINPETGGPAEGSSAPQYNDFSKYSSWMPVGKGSGTLPANPSPTADASKANTYPHSNSSPALFFYENMQGNYENQADYYKFPDPEIAAENWENGTISGPETNTENKWNGKDYRDNVPCGTFIEVEAYYTCSEPLSSGPIRYRFMLGQNITYNYNATRNHHYKVTLGFKGYANQPDWHIEYQEDDPGIFTQEIYIPYTYNTSVEVPIRITGNGLQTLEAQIIENNWAPYDEDENLEVPTKDSYGSTDFNKRTLEFVWYRSVFVNASGHNTNVKTNRSDLLKFSPCGANNVLGIGNSQSNYIYGLHPNGYYPLKEDGTEDTSKPYMQVTPIWAGFFRLRQPEQYTTVKDIPAVLLPNTKESGTANYSSNAILRAFRDYYFGCMDNAHGYGNNGYLNNVPSTGIPANYDYNATDLSYHRFDNLSQEKEKGDGLNDYGVEITKYKEKDADKTSTTVTMNLWTQPKSMCGISGFSGNNPYEDFNRKGVIRFTATFSDGRKISKDVTVIQAKRLVNPKAVWHSYDNTEPFNVTLYDRDLTKAGNESGVNFDPVISRGKWSAELIAGDVGSFAIDGGKKVTGSNQSQIQFQITFLERNLKYSDSRSAIIQIKYHGETCVHNIFVRQGYNEPTRLSDNALTPTPAWSSFNLYSFTADENVYGVSDKTIPAQLTCNPLSFGAFFKKGNYAQGISVSNISRNPENSTPNSVGFGPLQYPNGQGFYLVGTGSGQGTSNTPSWNNIAGITGQDNWKWAPISVHHQYLDGDESKGMDRKCHVPTIADFTTLLETDFGIGVLYGDGSTAPGETTTKAYGFLDPDNTTTVTPADNPNIGMRGFICYNSETAHQIFFPIGTSGIGRRTAQNVTDENQQGTLRYSSVPYNLNTDPGSANTMRPISVNMANAPGAIYWADGVNTDNGGWEMNYFDLNFNAVTHGFVSGTEGRRGNTGDAIPIRLIVDSSTPSISTRSNRSGR